MTVSMVVAKKSAAPMLNLFVNGQHVQCRTMIHCTNFISVATVKKVTALQNRSHLIMHRTTGLTDYYRTLSDGLMG